MRRILSLLPDKQPLVSILSRLFPATHKEYNHSFRLDEYKTWIIGSLYCFNNFLLLILMLTRACDHHSTVYLPSFELVYKDCDERTIINRYLYSRILKSGDIPISPDNLSMLCCN